MRSTPHPSVDQIVRSVDDDLARWLRTVWRAHYEELPHPLAYVTNPEENDLWTTFVHTVWAHSPELMVAPKSPLDLSYQGISVLAPMLSAVLAYHCETVEEDVRRTWLLVWRQANELNAWARGASQMQIDLVEALLAGSPMDLPVQNLTNAVSPFRAKPKGRVTRASSRPSAGTAQPREYLVSSISFLGPNDPSAAAPAHTRARGGLKGPVVFVITLCTASLLMWMALGSPTPWKTTSPNTGYALMAPAGKVGFTQPCSPVHVAVSAAAHSRVAPWQLATIRASLAKVSAAAHMAFVLDGITAKPGARSRNGRGPHAAVLISIDNLTGTQSAAAASTVLLGDALPDTTTKNAKNPWVGPWATAHIRLNSREFTKRYVRGDGTSAVVMHELAHVLGVDHYPSGLMNPTIDPDTSLDPGTRQALDVAGCHRQRTSNNG